MTEDEQKLLSEVWHPSVRTDLLELPEGQVMLQWPVEMSAESLHKLKEWMEGLAQ